MATASISVEANTGRGTREYVAATLEVLEELGIQYEFTAMSTNLEGDVESICKALSAVHARWHQLGAPRVVSLLKIDDRTDVLQTLETKVEHVAVFRSTKPPAPHAQRTQRHYTFIRSGHAQSAALAEGEITVWNRCPNCGSTDIQINPDVVDSKGVHHEPSCRISCGCCSRPLDDIIIDPAAPHYCA